MSDKAVKISGDTEDKLIALKHELEKNGVPYFKRTRKHLIGVAVDKAELLDESYVQYQRLWNHLAHYIRMFEEMYPTAKSPVEMWDAYDKMGDIMARIKAFK